MHFYVSMLISIITEKEGCWSLNFLPTLSYLFTIPFRLFFLYHCFRYFSLTFILISNASFEQCNFPLFYLTQVHLCDLYIGVDIVQLIKKKKHFKIKLCTSE